MSPAPLKMLAVDNELLLLTALERAFKNRSIEITTAATMPQAMAEIGKRQHDLFLLELNMIEPNSLELLKTIDVCCPYVPIIIMTTSDTDSIELHETISTLRKHGTWHLLDKPFSLDRLLHSIEQILKEKLGCSPNTYPLTQNYGKERRKQFRHPHVQPVNFTFTTFLDGVSTRVASKGILTDVSDGGYCLLVHERLQPDLVLTFDDESLRACGSVSWSMMIEAGTCRCGVQFC